MPRRDAAATSMVLYPAPARTTSFSGPGRQRGFIDFGRPHHQRFGLKLLHRFRQCGVLGRGLIGNFASGGGQSIQAGLFEFIGYEYAHGISVAWDAAAAWSRLHGKGNSIISAAFGLGLFRHGGICYGAVLAADGLSRPVPLCESVADDAEDGPPVLREQLEPLPDASSGKIDPTEK